MWALFTGGLLAGIRKLIGPRSWRLGHSLAAIVMIAGTVIHTWLIQGAMEDLTKAGLCVIVLAAGARALQQRKVWRLLR